MIIEIIIIIIAVVVPTAIILTAKSTYSVKEEQDAGIYVCHTMTILGRTTRYYWYYNYATEKWYEPTGNGTGSFRGVSAWRAKTLGRWVEQWRDKHDV